MLGGCEVVDNPDPAPNPYKWIISTIDPITSSGTSQ